MAENNEQQTVSEEDINAVLQILDQFGKSEEGRLKVSVSDTLEKGEVEKVHHLGRCDVGSPAAKGLGCDVPDDVKADDWFTMDLDADKKR